MFSIILGLIVGDTYIGPDCGTDTFSASVWYYIGPDCRTDTYSACVWYIGPDCGTDTYIGPDCGLILTQPVFR